MRVSDQASLQPTESLMRQVVDTPPPSFMLPADSTPVQCASSHCRGSEILLHRTPTKRTESTGLLMSNKVQNRTALQRKTLCAVRGNKGICSRFTGGYLSCAPVPANQSPELSSELSSPAALQFFLLFSFETTHESESL